MSDEQSFAARLDREIQGHQHSHDVSVIEHMNYEPYVKLKCGHCGGETYVRRDEATS